MISIIIPTLNEAENLPRFLTQIKKFEKTISYEVIFIDGGSTDGTVPLLHTQGYSVIETTSGRGHQLKTGVKASSGDILFFLHADSIFERSPLKEIYRLCQIGEFGAFSLRFIPSSMLLRLVSFGSNWRVKHRQIAFGDQGMFITRSAYDKVGGMRAIPIMEDYDFSIRAKEQQIKCQLSPQKIWTSSRYLKKHGVLKSLITMQKCQHLYRKGVSVQQIKKSYYK